MWSKKACTIFLCASTELLVSVVCVFAVVGSPPPINVTGGEAHIKEMSEVKNSLFEMNNIVNFVGTGIGSVLLMVVLIIIRRATHHVFVKRPNRILKHDRNSQTDERIVRLENILKERGYLA